MSPAKSNRTLASVTPSLVLARTARGFAEAVDTQSYLSPMLRHLLILLDGKAALKDLAARYHHGDILVAATLLWQHGYAVPVEVAAQPRGLLARLFERAPAPQHDFDDTLQSIFPGASREAKVRFSESGRYWFSLGGMAASTPPADAAPATPPAQTAAPRLDAARHSPRKR